MHIRIVSLIFVVFLFLNFSLFALASSQQSNAETIERLRLSHLFNFSHLIVFDVQRDFNNYSEYIYDSKRNNILFKAHYRQGEKPPAWNANLDLHHKRIAAKIQRVLDLLEQMEVIFIKVTQAPVPYLGFRTESGYHLARLWIELITHPFQNVYVRKTSDDSQFHKIGTDLKLALEFTGKLRGDLFLKVLDEDILFQAAFLGELNRMMGFPMRNKPRITVNNIKEFLINLGEPLSHKIQHLGIPAHIDKNKLRAAATSGLRSIPERCRDGLLNLITPIKDGAQN